MSNNKIKVTYGSCEASSQGFTEEVQIQYMRQSDCLYIVETAYVVSQGNTSRVWILEQVQNRPYYMRVTFLAEINNNYHTKRGYGGQLLKSLAALRNYVMAQDKE